MNPIIDKLKNLASSGTATLVEKIGDAFDKNFTSKEEREAAKLAAQKAIDEHNEKIAQVMFQQFEVEMKDMADSRNREIQIATSDKAPLINKIITPILALFIVISTIVIWALILFRNYEPKTNEAMIIGSLTTLCAGVISYYFGSSSGSKQKGEQIDKMINK